MALLQSPALKALLPWSRYCRKKKKNYHHHRSHDKAQEVSNHLYVHQAVFLGKFLTLLTSLTSFMIARDCVIKDQNQNQNRVISVSIFFVLKSFPLVLNLCLKGTSAVAMKGGIDDPAGRGSSIRSEFGWKCRKPWFSCFMWNTSPMFLWISKVEKTQWI